jgi:tetratricopeptide (TPR) repeat protein
MFMSRYFLPLLALCGLVVLAGYAALLAVADAAFRQDTLASAQSAVRLVPSNASYHALLAEILEETGSNPDPELQMATVLSPHESRYWIRRAFRAEVEQKYDESERLLLEARRVDHGFDPRWALMNYYFRRGNLPEFWKAAEQALEMSYGDLNPIFRLCLDANSDPSFTARILPPRRAILLSFFVYLLQHNLMDSTSPIAARLAAGADAEDVHLLLNYCDRQMGHDNQSSLAIWNTLCQRHLVGFAELSPERGNIVTNTDLVAASLRQGFDWKYGGTPEIAAAPLDTGQGISFEISGFQPDSVVLLEQELPLAPREQYILNYEYRLIGELPDSGLQWVIHRAGPVAAGTDPSIAASPALSGSDWSTGHMRFSSGQLDAGKLVLQYRRSPGTLRWKGTVQIRHVTSGLAPANSGGRGK